MADIPFRIGLYEAKTVVPIQSLDAGTHYFNMGMPAGNSLLSTVYVEAVDSGASVKVNYFDNGPGDGTLPGERVDLSGHKSITTAPISDRQVITRIANKPKIEVIVSGGSVTIGVHIAVVADFPQNGMAQATEIIRTTATTTWTEYPTIGFLDGFELECDRDNNNNRRIWIALDDSGVNYTTLAPGDSIEQDLLYPGKIYIRSAASNPTFSLWVKLK